MFGNGHYIQKPLLMEHRIQYHSRCLTNDFIGSSPATQDNKFHLLIGILKTLVLLARFSFTL